MCERGGGGLGKGRCYTEACCQCIAAETGIQFSQGLLCCPMQCKQSRLKKTHFSNREIYLISIVSGLFLDPV